MKNLLLFFMIAIMGVALNAKEKYTNSLINEESPYLLQHANNPVNWYAWNKESLKRAKDENKMIFLSIGYSTCHWCHVMEEESFLNEEVANILNKHFISIKIDREEMPHVDEYYQELYKLVNKRSGGWPLTVVLTPQRKAFYLATYIPLYEKAERIGIIELLSEIQNSFTNDKKRVYETSESIQKLQEENKYSKKEKKQLHKGVISQFVKQIEDSFDYENKGIGHRPKFPHASSIETLLDIYSVYKNKKALTLALDMLKAMAKGGINDQIEGGFYRYSVDEKWMIPHFEKMLYTNAELLSSYIKAYKITNDDFFKSIAQQIIMFTKERFEVNNLLFSASDADSLLSFESTKKEEGVYFVFNYEQTSEFLENKGYDEKQIEEILNYFNISFEGNFENGLSNPYLASSKENTNQIFKNINKIKKDLKELRLQKPYPFIDNKIITSWNAMYISSLFEAKAIDVQYAKNAKVLLDSLIKNLYIDEVLYHQRIVDKKPKVKALLEDYAFLIDALLKAYDFTLEEEYLIQARNLNKEAITKFYKDETWFLSDDEFKVTAGVYDSQYRSALSQMIDNILRLALLSDDLELQNLAKNSLELNSMSLSSKPSKTAWLLRTYMAYNKQYISLKAQKSMLKEKNYPNYPFLLKKEDNSVNKYLACKIGVCFAYSTDFEEIIRQIKKSIK